MAGEWQDVSIGEIADVVGGSTPSTADPSNFDGNIPWLTPKDLSGPHPRYVQRGERNLSAKGLASCSAQLLPANSILLSSRAPIGYVAIAANPLATNQGFRSLILKPGYDHEFLYYWLTANVEELERHASGSTFKELSGSSLKKIRVRLPRDLAEQRAIAHILGTLDDKIELNRRMSETLEAMAQALFKAWFVDFEPVRAKMEGRWQRGQSLPGLPAHLYDLFPDRLVDSELGEIPEGWRVGKVDDLCTRVENGGTPRRMEPIYWGGSIPWFKTGELTDGPLLASEETITEEGLSSSSCKLWPIGTILIALYASPTVGRLGILEVPAAANQACSALLARPEYGNLFLFYTLLATRERLQQIAVGAAQQNISQQAVRDHKFIVPPAAIARAFHDSAQALYRRRVGLISESRTLAALRDTLLPKLIRGEIRVNDAERFLKEREL